MSNRVNQTTPRDSSCLPVNWMPHASFLSAAVGEWKKEEKQIAVLVICRGSANHQRISYPQTLESRLWASGNRAWIHWEHEPWTVSHLNLNFKKHRFSWIVTKKPFHFSILLSVCVCVCVVTNTTTSKTLCPVFCPGGLGRWLKCRSYTGLSWQVTMCYSFASVPSKW